MADQQTNVGEAAGGAPAASGTAAPAAPAARGAPDDAQGRGVPAAKMVLTRDQLTERLQRARRAALTEALGTDDVAAVKARLKRAEELEKKAEEQRLAQLSEIDRARELARAAERREREARSQLTVERERRITQEQDVYVARLAARHINQRYVPEATLAFAREVRRMPESDAAKLDESSILKWFSRYAADKREIAASPKAREQRTPAGAAAPPPRAPATAGARPPVQSFAPSAPNAMSPREARAAAAKMGYKW